MGLMGVPCGLNVFFVKFIALLEILMRKIFFFEFVAIFFASFALTACFDNSASAEEFNAVSVCPQSGRGTFVDDRDGQVYKFTTIGNQVWMAQNLKYSIPNKSVLEPDSGVQVIPVTKCYENENNCTKNGYLYNWYAAYYSCPSGWHLPSEKEWLTLIKNMGGNEEANTRLRATSGWKTLNRDENPNGTDDCDFSLAPVKSSLLDTADSKYEVFVWTSTNHYDRGRKLYADFISYHKDVIFNSADRFSDNMTVRCLKD